MGDNPDVGSGVPAAPRSGYVLRERLYGILSAHPRVVVRAEGGAGKTSLVASWLARENGAMPTLWISVDENCRTRRSFWQRVVDGMMARGAVAPDGPLARYLSGELNAADVPSLVVGELQVITSRMRVIFDDIHLLDDEAQRDLVWVLERVERLQCIATSRVTTHLEDGAVARRLGTVTVGSEDLAFSAKELDGLAKQLDIPLTRRERDLIRSVTQGNVLVSRLSVVAVGRRVDFETEGERARAIKAIAEEMRGDLLPSFDSPDDALVAGILALAPLVDRQMAQEMIGAHDAWQHVERFARQGIGYRSRTDEGREIFSFHPLIGAALASRAAETLPGERLKSTKRIAAGALSGWGDPVEVLRLYLGAEEYGAFWATFVRAFSPLTTHRVDEVARLLSPLPEHIARENWGVATAFAIALDAYEAQPSAQQKQLCAWALAALEVDLPELSGLPRVLAHTARFGVLRVLRRYDEAADAGTEVVDAFERIGPSVRATIGGGAYAVRIQLMITEILAGRLHEAIAHGNGMAGDTITARLWHRDSLVAYGRAMIGNMAEAERTLARFPEELPDAWPGAVPAYGWNLARALLALEQGRFDDVRSILISLAPVAPFFEHWAMMIWIRGVLGLLEGDVLGARSELAREVKRSKGRGIGQPMRAALLALQADLATAAQDHREARRILAAAPDTPAVRLARARQELAAFNPERALALARSVIEGTDQTRWIVDARLTAALAQRRLGLHQDAAAEAQRAASYLHAHRLTTPLIFIPRAERRALLGPDKSDPVSRFADPFIGLSAPALSDRELAVLEQLCTDETVTGIAEKLFVSPNTVKSQIRSIYRKLGVTQRTAAVKTARERGLV